MSSRARSAAAANNGKALEFSKALAGALLDDKVKNKFILDIDKYTKTTKMVEDKFRTVYDKLEAFDSEGLGGTGSTPLHETWEGFQTRFSEQLAASETLAGEMADSCYDYLSTIVKPAAKLSVSKEIQDVVVQRLLKEIETFLSEGKDMETRAGETRDAFAKLAAEIKTFRDNFDKYGEGRKTENLARIDQLDKDIAGLKGEISDLEGHIRRLGWGMVGVGVGTAVLATATAFFPLASLAIFAIGVTAVVGQATAIAVLEGQINDKRDEIKEKEKSKTAIEAENARIDAIRTELAQMGKNEIQDILGGIEFFKVLWAEVIGDVHSIRGYLEKIQRRTTGVEPEEYPDSVSTFLKTGTTLSYGLSRGLKLYSIGVESADSIEYGIPIE